MISLKRNQSLRVLLALDATTTELPVVCSYKDGEGQRRKQHTVQTITTGDAAKSILAGGSGDSRDINFLSIVNVDTAAATVTLQFVDNNGVVRELAREVLAVGDSLFFSEETGFRVVDSNGGQKTTATVPTTKLDKSENAYIRTDVGTKDLLAAAAAARVVMIVVTVTTVFANGDGGQPTLTIGEQDGSATKFAAAAKFTGGAAGLTLAFSGTLSAGKKLQATLVAATGATSTGAYTIDVIAVG